jgi:hypothetical protein
LISHRAFPVEKDNITSEILIGFLKLLSGFPFKISNYDRDDFRRVAESIEFNSFLTFIDSRPKSTSDVIAKTFSRIVPEAFLMIDTVTPVKILKSSNLLLKNEIQVFDFIKERSDQTSPILFFSSMFMDLQSHFISLTFSIVFSLTNMFFFFSKSLFSMATSFLRWTYSMFRRF